MAYAVLLYLHQSDQFLMRMKYTRSKNFWWIDFRDLPCYGKSMPDEIKDIQVSIRMSTNKKS